MDKIYTKHEWWEEEYGFFGSFYHTGDNSVEGYDATNKLNREQRTQREVGFVEKYLNPQIGDKILDCPCGSGRHDFPLAKKGYDVTGVDINNQMLSFRSEFLNNSTNRLPDFKQMDMRNLTFGDNTFNFIINLFLSFGFFKTDVENEKVVQEFYRVLKPNGKLMIHLDLNYDRVIQGRYLGEENITRECSWGGEEKTLEVLESYDPINKRLQGTWKLLNGVEKIKSYDLRVYDNQSEFIPLFKRNGFKEVILIDPDKSIFDINSKETILVATK